MTKENICATCGHAARDHLTDVGYKACEAYSEGKPCLCKEFRPVADVAREKVRLIAQSMRVHGVQVGSTGIIEYTGLSFEDVDLYYLRALKLVEEALYNPYIGPDDDKAAGKIDEAAKQISL